MDVVALVGALLSGLHGTLNFQVCPGDWMWTTAAAGSFIALFPVLGSMLAALLRRFVGNRYSLGVIATFLVLGLCGMLVLPWMAFNGVFQVFGRSTGVAGYSGLAAADFTTLQTGYCFLPHQDRLLAGGNTVAQVLGSPGNLFFFAGYLLALGLLPLLCLFFVRWQARVAFRRGPMWPARVFWMFFALFILLTGQLGANVVALLWAGFLPASVVGVFAVRLVGAPSWALINRPKPAPPRPPQEDPVPRPAPPASSQTRLADTPGPLPSTLAKAAPSTKAKAPPPTRALSSPASTQVAPTALGQDPLASFAGGRFRFVRPLGRGGFGQVWLATDTSLGRMVAVKIAHASNVEAGQRMQREARALAALHHPNCVRVYDLVDGPDGLAIVMEYIEGDSLADVVQTGRALDDTAAARVWVTVAGALAAAHGTGVLHRDVKPANVIVDEAGTAHLIDFGIAQTRGDSSITATGTMLGTPDFLAPEVARGAAATPESDSWQLAATVSFALTGLPPRGNRDTPVSALLAAANGETCSVLPQRSVHRRLLSAALDGNPARRPPLAVVIRQLNAWLAHAGLSSDGPVTTMIRPIRQPAPLPRRSQPPKSGQ